MNLNIHSNKTYLITSEGEMNKRVLDGSSCIYVYFCKLTEWQHECGMSYLTYFYSSVIQISAIAACTGARHLR